VTQLLGRADDASWPLSLSARGLVATTAAVLINILGCVLVEWQGVVLEEERNGGLMLLLVLWCGGSQSRIEVEGLLAALGLDLHDDPHLAVVAPALGAQGDSGGCVGGSVAWQLWFDGWKKVPR
jgi:hypothetical protein